MAEPNDTDVLMLRVASGSKDARDVVLSRYRERLKQMVRMRMHGRVKARFDPSDVVQEALLIANRRLDELATQQANQPPAERIPIYVWLRKITWEQLIKFHERHIQAAKRSVASETGQLGDLNDSSIQLLVDQFAAKQPATKLPDHLERAEIIRNALNSLKRQDREILELRYLEQLSNVEIAASLGISESAVRTRHFRALQRLQRTIE